MQYAIILGFRLIKLSKYSGYAINGVTWFEWYLDIGSLQNVRSYSGAVAFMDHFHIGSSSFNFCRQVLGHHMSQVTPNAKLSRNVYASATSMQYIVDSFMVTTYTKTETPHKIVSLRFLCPLDWWWSCIHILRSYSD